MWAGTLAVSTAATDSCACTQLCIHVMCNAISLCFRYYLRAKQTIPVPTNMALSLSMLDLDACRHSAGCVAHQLGDHIPGRPSQATAVAGTRRMLTKRLMLLKGAFIVLHCIT